VGVFNGHAGTVSFGAEKTLRVAQNRTVINTRYPSYQTEYAGFKRRDPLKEARLALNGALSQPLAARWLDEADRPQAPRCPDTAPLPSAVRRIAIWDHKTNSLHAGKVQQLARLVANQPHANLRLLVIGDMSEMLWHTGVVESVSRAQTNAKALFDDAELLSLANCAVVLMEEGCTTPLPGHACVDMNNNFDPAEWLSVWQQNNFSGKAA
jgi:hypothetical protein